MILIIYIDYCNNCMNIIFLLFKKDNILCDDLFLHTRNQNIFGNTFHFQNYIFYVNIIKTPIHQSVYFNFWGIHKI